MQPQEFVVFLGRETEAEKGKDKERAIRGDINARLVFRSCTELLIMRLNY